MAKVIKVTLPNGEDICYRSPLHTFIEVLKWIGEERFSEIPIKINNRPLVSHEAYHEIKDYTIEILPGWYYIRQADTEQRYLQLRSINEAMSLGLKIEIGDFKGKKNPITEGSTRPKSLLQVTMPDGEVIDYESYKDVFATVIDKLGPHKVLSRANFDLNRNQPLLTVTNPNGDRLKIADMLYLAIPYTVRKSANVLSLIAKRLGLATEMKIEVSPTKKDV